MKSSRVPRRRHAALTRRAVLVGAGAAGTGLALARSAGERETMPSLADPALALRTWARLVADPGGGRVVYSFQSGTVHGFLPQGDDVTLAQFARELYGYRSCVARLARLERDGSLRLRTRGWVYHTSVETGELIRELENPYTRRRVAVPVRALPPSEQHIRPDGRPGSTPPPPFPAESSEMNRPFRLEWSSAGERVWMRRRVYSRFRPPDTTWFKLEADFVTHLVRLEDVRAAGTAHIPNTISHNLVAEWQTWMNMHGAPGHILFVGQGAHVFDPSELPEAMQADLEREFPGALGERLRWGSDP